MDRRSSIVNGSSQTAISQAQSTKGTIRDSFKVRRRQPIVTVVKVVARETCSTISTKGSLQNVTETNGFLETTYVTSNPTSGLLESTAKNSTTERNSPRSSISSPSTFVKKPKNIARIPPVSARTRSQNATSFAAAKNDSNLANGNAGEAKKQSSKMTNQNGGTKNSEVYQAGASRKELMGRQSKKSPHNDPSQPSQEPRVSSQFTSDFSPEMAAEYLQEKSENIADLRILRDSLKLKRGILDKKTSIYKEQAAITAGILEKEAEMWKYGGPLSNSCALLEHQMTTIMTKQVAMEKLQNDVKERISQIIRLIVSGEERLADAEVKQNLGLQTPLKLEGSRDLAQLIEDAIAAKTNFCAAEEDAFIHVGHGKYYPPLVCALVSVGILRFHEDDPTRVVLNCTLGRH